MRNICFFHGTNVREAEHLPAKLDRGVLTLTVEGDIIFTPKLKIGSVDVSPTPFPARP